MYNLIMFLASCQNSEKSSDPILGKHPDRCHEGRMDRSRFHRIIPVSIEGLTSTTAVAWQLKVKEIQYSVGLTKKELHHSQHAKKQFRSKIHSADISLS